MAQTNDHKSSDLCFRVGILGVAAALGAMSIIGMMRFVDHFRPRIGDIIAFDPQKVASPSSEPRMTVSHAGMTPEVRCILDARTMRQSNGSLIIEAALPETTFGYRVHWAGGPTSGTAASCGSTANLLLSEAQITALKMAASR